MKTVPWLLAAALLFSGLLGRLAHVNAELTRNAPPMP